MENILLLTIDCLRSGRLRQANRKAKTETLRELSREGLFFENAFATGPFTPESFPGMFAGLESRDTPHMEQSYILKGIPSGAPTVASELRKSGYKTVATITNSHLTRERNFDHGFEAFSNLRTEGYNVSDNDDLQSGLGRLLSDLQSRFIEGGTNLPVFSKFGRGVYTGYRYSQYPDGWPSVDGKTVISRFVDDLQKANQNGEDSPVFGWAHLMDLHAPLHPDAVFAGPEPPTESLLRMLYWDSFRATQTSTKKYAPLYDAVLNYVDSLIQNLIDGLKRMDVWHETTLIVTGDHGEALFGRDVFGHGQNYMFDEVLGVPLIVRTPDLDTRTIQRQFSLGWLHELISETTRAPDLDLPSSSRDTHTSQEGDSGVIVSDSINKYGHTISVRDGQHKLSMHAPAPGWDWPPKELIGPLEEDAVFDLQNDPGELSPIEPTEAPELKSLAEERITLPSEVPILGDSISAEVENNLKDMGYML